MRRQELREKVEDLSLGLLSTTINLSISLVAFGAITATSRRNPHSVTRAVESATTVFGINKDSLKRAFWQAKHKKLLKRKREKGRDYWIATALGRKRLTTKLPVYQPVRPWDKRLYLVTYDIPEKKHADRTKLRQNLITLGARRFQDSVYLILWDPTEVIKRIVQEHAIAGSVIVSDMGTDGSIGEKNLDELIWEVFELEELNNRYEEFLQKIKQEPYNPFKLAFLYLSILKDDPQLPFNLLGPTWKGDKAYQMFQGLKKETNISL